MNEVKFLRKGATIRTLNEDGTHSDEQFKIGRHYPAAGEPSISQAKRKSRELQKQHGPGSLRVVTKFPAEQASQ